MNPEYAATFWKCVDKAMRNAGVPTYKELALKAGIKQQRLNEMRSDMKLPTTIDAVAIARVLGTSVEHLLTGTPDVPYPQAIREIADMLVSLDTQQLDTVRKMVNGLASGR